MSERKFITIFTWLVILLVGSIAVISFYLSYAVLAAVAREGGKQGGLALLWPLIIDLPVVAFSIAAIFAIVLGHKYFGWFCRWVVVVATGVTIYFNVTYASNHDLSWEVAIAAPIAYVVSFEVLAWLFEVLSTRSMSVRKLSEIRIKIGEYRSKLRDMADNWKNEQATAKERSDNLQAEFANQKGKLEAGYGQFEAELQDNRDKAIRQFESDKRQLSGQLDSLNGQLDIAKQTLGSYQSDIEAAKTELAELAKQSTFVYLPDNLSIDQRQQVVGKMVNDGHTIGDIATWLNVSEGTVKNDKRATKVNLNGH